MRDVIGGLAGSSSGRGGMGSAKVALLGGFLWCAIGVAPVLASASATEEVNRTVPKVTAPTPLNFSSSPADVEFLHTGLFAEPLAPVASNTPLENRELAEALLTYRDAVERTGGNDAVDPLLAFLAKHPNSSWKPVLELNLGIIYRQTGHFSKALAIWQEGWEETRTLSDPRGHALANAMVGRLSQLEAYLGRKELLEPLLDSLKDRSIGGTAAQWITNSHTGLYHMTYFPGESFRCGPLALSRILRYGGAHPSPAALRAVEEARSTDHGLSLTMVQEIATQAGMKYQMAYRTPGSEVILPAVANWKVGHYAALVAREKGRLLVQDTTFGDDIRMSPPTLDEESSGYFLVPVGPLPRGWRHVSAAEGATVWGRGDNGSNHDGGATGAGAGDGGSAGSGSGCGGCTTSAVELEVVGLQLHDTPVGYKPPLGPEVRFKLYYSHRDMQQPGVFSYTNFGPKWTFNWLSYVTDTVNTSASAVLYLRGGGNEFFTFSSTSATTAYPGPYDQAILTRSVNGGGTTTGFTLTFPDGSYEQFDQALGNQFFMTATSDAAGNITTLTYDAQMRIVAITDAIGQVTTISYGLSGSPLVVTKITDPFGRSASFSYYASGQLASITDVLGITSSYTYGQGTDPDFINTLTTPYGSTTFTYGDSSTNPSLGNTRFLLTTDPLGRTSYVEYSTTANPGDVSGGAVNSAFVPSGMTTCNQLQNIRNTFTFDANQYALATGGGGLNYSFGKAIHWMRTSDALADSRIKESEKEPLENRVWYVYPGEYLAGGCYIDSSQFGVSSTGVVTNGASARPAAIGRVIDSGATQLQTFQYNSNGNVIQATDAVGRQFSYGYAANGIDRLTMSNTTSGTQLLETRTYNSLHLPLTITGTNGRTDHYEYNAAGQMTQHTDALGHVTIYSYDGSGHLKSLQQPIASAKYTFAYDNVSRLSSVTDPAGSTVHFTYDAADRPLKTTYPDGTTRQLAYTLLDRTSSTDRLGQKTRYQYDADRELISITDPFGNITKQGFNLAGVLNSITDGNGHTTNFVLDDESRVTTKQFANGTSLNVLYDNSITRIATITDALSQTTDYTYNIDNTLSTVSYSAQQATPSVSFTYDPIYPRITSMTDGVGTTTYTYYPVSNPALGANQLQSVSSPIAGTSNSDTLQYNYDALNRVNGYTLNGAVRSIGYDALGRVTSASNPLDSFTYNYSDGTSRVTGVTSNSGPTAALTYFGATGDELLEQLNITTHSGGASLAQFGYTYNADDNVKTLTVSSPSAQTTTYGYDTANRLVTALIGTGSPQYVYGYDHASNLTSITPNGPVESFSYTSTNALTIGTYDANGSPKVLSGNSYKWDGANRLIRFANSANNTGSSFTYDGLGRLVRVVDTHGGSITADHSYTWCGSVRCLAHDNTQSGSPVSTQYFDQGAIISGTSYYYIKDQLGSVTQLVTNTGSVTSQYAYDSYGYRSTVSGTLVSDIGYAGYFYHAVSGLEFALHRAYDPIHARWLNRDPIGEAGGVNLYAYVDEDPLYFTDPSGQFGVIGLGIGVVTGAIAGYVASGTVTGALTGGLIGGVVGIVAPELSGEAGAAVAAATGSEAAGSAVAGATFVAANTAAGYGSAVYGNLVGGNDNLTENANFGAAVGAFSVLGSGEAFIIAAGGDAVVGQAVENSFSTASGALGILGAAITPNPPASCHP